MRQKKFVWLFLVGLVWVPTAHAAVSLEQVAAFAGQPGNDDPQLSADGKLIAVQRMVDGQETVAVIQLDSGEVLQPFQFKQNIDIERADWIDSEHLILRSRRNTPYFGGAPQGLGAGRPERFNFRTLEVEKLFSKYEFTEKLEDYSLRQRFGATGERYGPMGRRNPTRITFRTFPRSNDARAIVQHDFSGTTGKAGSGNQRNVVGSSKIMRYDMANEEYEELANIEKMTIHDVYTNAKGHVLAAWGQPARPRSNTWNELVRLIYRASPKDEWNTLYEGHLDDGAVALIGDGPKKNTVYLLETITGKYAALSYLDLKTGKITPIFRPARTDVSAYYVDGENSLYAVRYDDHYPQYHYPNPKHLGAQIHQVARKRFKNMNVTLTSFARDNSRAIVHVEGDNDPGQYWWFDVKTTRMQKLFNRYPRLDNHVFAQRNPIEFPARDDVRISGYLTIPSGLMPPKKPLVVLIKGGPETTNNWGFDWRSQLFASFGFAVLEVNHRGALGFGTSFTKAGFGEWGNMILDDIATGVRWVKKNASVVSSDVCIVGNRFGGYAALMSVIERPGVFSCAVSIDNYDSDLYANWNRLQRRGSQERDEQRKVGLDPDINGLKDASPRWRARSIRQPILLVEPMQGFANFAYAQAGNAQNFIDELRQGSIDHQVYIVESDRSDNWLKDTDVARGYFEVAKFLEQHLL
tara:strand:+ start:170 stop:2245 length:2076 start_codon:yes stop_codon:yes gene_type:complete